MKTARLWPALIGLIILAGFIAAGLGLPASPARAQAEPALERLFTAEEADRAWFAPELLAHADVDAVLAIIRGLKGTLGGYRGVQREGPDTYTVFLERGRVPAEVRLDDEGRITYVFLGEPTAAPLTPREALGGFVRLERAGGGALSVLVTRDGADLVALAPDDMLDAGPAFTLAVLRAVAARAEEGGLAWDEVVPLKAGWRSLPGGLLHDWPDGAPLTVQTLATLMMSLSDNTATDVLMARLGRAAVEAHLPAAPVLTTAEYFKLKANVKNMRARYRAADEAGRRAVLAELAAAPLPDPAALDDMPTPEIGWHVPVRRLCALAREVAGLAPMRVNPGVAAGGGWRQVAFKDGFAAGTASMTTHLVDDAGTRWCVAATWNTDPAALDRQGFEAAYKALVGSLAQDTSARAR